MLYNKVPEQRSIPVFVRCDGKKKKLGCHFYEFAGAKGMLASPPHKLLRVPSGHLQREQQLAIVSNDQEE
jgi:hypothetical protein